jgi:hypothetical protein
MDNMQASLLIQALQAITQELKQIKQQLALIATKK